MRIVFRGHIKFHAEHRLYGNVSTSSPKAARDRTRPASFQHNIMPDECLRHMSTSILTIILLTAYIWELINFLCRCCVRDRFWLSCVDILLFRNRSSFITLEQRFNFRSTSRKAAWNACTALHWLAQTHKFNIFHCFRWLRGTSCERHTGLSEHYFATTY